MNECDHVFGINAFDYRKIAVTWPRTDHDYLLRGNSLGVDFCL